MPTFNATTPTVEISVSSSSQRVRVGAASMPSTLVPVRICNDGTATVWVRGGDSAVTVTSTTGQTNTGQRVPAGAIEVQSFVPGADGVLWIAAIAAASTGSVEFTAGYGI
jgi:hypothetical protein